MRKWKHKDHGNLFKSRRKQNKQKKTSLTMSRNNIHPELINRWIPPKSNNRPPSVPKSGIRSIPKPPTPKLGIRLVIKNYFNHHHASPFVRPTKEDLPPPTPQNLQSK